MERRRAGIGGDQFEYGVMVDRKCRIPGWLERAEPLDDVQLRMICRPRNASARDDRRKQGFPQTMGIVKRQEGEAAVVRRELEPVADLDGLRLKVLVGDRDQLG